MLNVLQKKQGSYMKSDRVLSKDEWELEQTIASLLERGMIEVVTDDDGNVGYRPTQLGMEVFNEHAIEQ